MEIKIGTRKSLLAMWQANHVKDALEAQGVHVTLLPIETKGDKVLDVSIAKIGSKGVFTEELEAMLESGEIDIAIHSAKDLPSELPAQFDILAFSAREKANDVLVSHNKSLGLKDSHAAFKIGTSSTRRIATLAHYFPNIETVEIRGNLQTRIGKMEAGHCDALLLAYAGVARMGYHGLINQELPLDIFTPAVGQGSLAVEIAISLSAEKKAKVRDIINDPTAEIILKCERAFLRKLKGGCSIPAFAYAHIDNGKLVLKAGIFSLNGKENVKKTMEGTIDSPAELGLKMGEFVLQHGGTEILAHINSALNRG
ncbi:MAG: hydroxymethylbilane synthase [Cyclobacteriaceae bacterium]|nr:hydroxymethylbilane synthase [Cyclobacteriaceae bacterium]